MQLPLKWGTKLVVQDAWLYETCTQCLQHMIDVVAQFYNNVQPLLGRILDLLSNFIRCDPSSKPHSLQKPLQSLLRNQQTGKMVALGDGLKL